jgi:hypothetical protein
MDKYGYFEKLSKVCELGQPRDIAIKYKPADTKFVWCDGCTKIITNDPCYSYEQIDVCTKCYNRILDLNKGLGDLRQSEQKIKKFRESSKPPGFAFPLVQEPFKYGFPSVQESFTFG